MAKNLKSNPKDLPATLSSDPKVVGSMKAIQRAGFWAFVVAIIAPLILAINLAAGGEKNTSLYILPIIGLYLAYSGWQMNNLKGRKSIILMLLINMVISVVLVVGIFPIFMFIMSLIALIRIRPYLKWSKNGGEPLADDMGFKRIKKRSESGKHEVTVLDPTRGEVTELRTIDEAMIQKYANKNGEVFAVRAYKQGRPSTRLVKEDDYRAALKTFGL